MIKTLSRNLNYHGKQWRSEWKNFWRVYKSRGYAEIGPGCVIHPSAILAPGVFVGRNSRLGVGTVMEKNTHVSSDSALSRITLGQGAHLDSRVNCIGSGGGRITLGKHFYCGVEAIFDHSADITFGDYIQLAPACHFWTHSTALQVAHSLPISNKDPNYRPTAPIRVGSNVYFGARATVYPGITIGDGVIVSPGAIITKDVPDNVMVGGVPAVIIKQLEPIGQRDNITRFK